MQLFLILWVADMLCPCRDKAKPHEIRATSQFMRKLDECSSKVSNRLIVVATTCDPAGIEPALRRPARFTHEILVGVPSLEERKAILDCLLGDLGDPSGTMAKFLAENTPGYTGADLKALLVSIEATMGSSGGAKVCPPDENDAIRSSLRLVQPSGFRSGGSDGTNGMVVPKTKDGWDDIGGLEKVKEDLQAAVSERSHTVLTNCLLYRTIGF